MQAWATSTVGKNVDLQASLNCIIEVQKILRTSPFEHPAFEQGPLEKNLATETLLSIYKASIAKSAQFSLNTRNEILLTIYPGEEYFYFSLRPQFFNLTYLLAEADFTQFVHHSSDDRNPTLSAEEKEAINLYTGSLFKSVNRLLRTGRLPPSAKLEDIKYFFESACRISSGLNKISSEDETQLYSLFHTAKIQFGKANHLIDCNERKYLPEILQYALTQNIMIKAQVNRLVEFHFLGSFRISEYIPQGITHNEGFLSSSRGKIAFEYTSINTLVHSTHSKSIRHHSNFEYEAETLGRSGQQHHFVKKDGIVFSSEINTPALAKPQHYPWLRALQYAYDNHLCRPYQELYESTAIPRANHGLVHTARKLMYTDAVIEFLAKHAEDAQNAHFIKLFHYKKNIN